MEEGIIRPDLAERISEVFSTQKKDIRTYSPLTLAFLGDCVFDLVIRTVLVEQGNRSVNNLHRDKSRLVMAKAQAELIEAVMELLTEEEEAVYKRGRNAKSVTMPKNAEAADYRKATGLEALVGYLYLTGNTERVLELVREGLRRRDVTTTDE